MELIIAVNVIAFLVMGLDKYKAQKGNWRIKEETLFLLALAMGATGVLAGMYAFRHKTRQMRFLVGVPALIAVNAACYYWFQHFAVK